MINPKTVDDSELYGAYDPNTREWSDGLITATLRRCCCASESFEKWIILDGPVDTLWIESMNTVLDDNRVLTLINGDRIALTPTISLLFEVAFTDNTNSMQLRLKIYLKRHPPLCPGRQ